MSIWLLISVLLALFDPTHVFIHRQNFDKAAAAFHRDPTPENETALRVEQQENQSIRDKIRIVEAVGLFLTGLLCYGVYATVRYALAYRSTMRLSKL